MVEPQITQSDQVMVQRGEGNALARLWGRLGAWLSQERVFRAIPFWVLHILFLSFLTTPFLTTLYITTLKWRANRPFEQAYFYGLGNFKDVITDGPFWEAIGRTFYFAGTAVALELLIGFFLAMLAYKAFRGRAIYITIFLIPMMVVPVVAGYNFSMIYIDSGPLNQLLAPFLKPFGIDPRIRWLSNPIAAQWACILADVWQWTSLTFLIFVSGFSALPQQLINAARIMGASRWQTFIKVQLPLLKPCIIIAVIIRSMEALKMFDISVLLTYGGPGNSTETIAFYLWQQVWRFNKFSFGSAASVLLLIMFANLIFWGIYLLIRQRAIIREEAI